MAPDSCGGDTVAGRMLLHKSRTNKLDGGGIEGRVGYYEGDGLDIRDLPGYFGVRA